MMEPILKIRNCNNMMMKIKSLVNLIIHTVYKFVLVIFVPNCPMFCNNTVLKHIQSKCDTLKKTQSYVHTIYSKTYIYQITEEILYL